MSSTMEKRKWKLSRRDFLIALGVVGGGVAVSIKLGLPQVRLALARNLEGAGGIPEEFSGPPTAWFEILPDNTVRIFIPKAEMGQGIHTALAQIAAEELEVDWQQIEVRHLAPHLAATGQEGSGITSGSNSVASMYNPLRETAATMREMLRSEAAKQWGLPETAVVVERGTAYVATAPNQRKTYGEIVAAADSWEIPEQAPALKPRREFRVIGESKKRLDLQAKITGQAVYGYDARLPGMLFGAVARPPLIGAKLRSARAGSAHEKPGVIEAVVEKDFAGVVAESRMQAKAALAGLELSWSDPKPWQQHELEAMVTVGQGNGTRIQLEGEGVQRFFDQLGALQSEYRTPFAAHAHLEPQAALAHTQENMIEIWTATQAPWSVQTEVASALGYETEQVHVYPTYLGGGFGRRIGSDVALEAARLSAAVQRPVHVGWDRNEEFRHGFLRPPTHSLLRAALDSDGNIVAMQHNQASGDVAFPFIPSFLSAVMGADFGAWRGAMVQYGIPNRETIAWRTKLPIPTGWWRGLGLLANIFALESFMDDLAFSTGADPLEYRLRNLPAREKQARYRRVLETAAERAGWHTSVPAGRARGIALCDDVGTIVAQVAEVSVENGQIRVHRVTAAMDCGLVINPDGANAQAQGAIMMGLSSTLKEQIIIKDGRVRASNFDRYPLLSINEAPDIDVVLIESGEQPFGVGEPPIGPIAAAVANAVFALTGQRLRELPLQLA